MTGVRPLRLLLLSTPIGPLGSGAGGGVELTVTNTARALQARGHAVRVLCGEGSAAPGIDLLPLPGGPPPSAQHLPRDAPIVMPAGGLLAAMCETARELQPDVDVIVNYAYDWLPLYLTPFFTTPLLHVVSMGSLTDAIDEAAEAALGHRSGCLAVHTRAQAATFPFADRLRVIGNGLQLETYTVQPTVDDALGWVARISPEKGLEDAVAAAERAGLPLRVWGYVEDEAYWAHVRATAAEGTIDYRGFLPTAELQAELGRCRALLVTPRWEEAFGNVVAEALACGVPVVSYDRGGPAELVVDGVTGFIVPPDDVDALAGAVARVGAIDRSTCRRHAEEQFSADALAARVEAWVGGFAG